MMSLRSFALLWLYAITQNSVWESRERCEGRGEGREGERRGKERGEESANLCFRAISVARVKTSDRPCWVLAETSRYLIALIFFAVSCPYAIILEWPEESVESGCWEE
jgi:hypothetical protein